MSAKRVCDMSCGAMHELALRLDKAGFDADLVQEVVESRGNKLAKQMYVSVRPEPKLVEKPKNPEISLPYPEKTNALLFLWTEFWDDILGIVLKDVNLPRPAYQTGYDWPIVMPPKMGNQQSLELVKKFFPTSQYWPNLDILNVQEEYLVAVDAAPVVLVRSVVEAEVKLSYNQAVQRRIPFIGIRQYNCLCAFLGWCHQNKLASAENLNLSLHLDVAGWTRTCHLGSVGSVASGRWFSDFGRVVVFWSDRGFALSHGGFRQAVM